MARRLGMTLEATNFDGVIANLRQYPARALPRVKDEIEASRVRTYNLAQTLCPVLSGFMRDKMVSESTPEGLGYAVGFRARDFVGQVNPFTGQRITDFYPFFQEFGTSKMAAQPCIYPARDIERPRLKAAVRRALRTS